MSGDLGAPGAPLNNQIALGPGKGMRKLGTFLSYELSGCKSMGVRPTQFTTMPF